MLGVFITFEGIEGCGKTTQIGMLKEYLESKNYPVLMTREPGGTGLGERIRAILLNSSSEIIAPLAEFFLYEACRAQILEEVIKPALKNNKIVLCDRFADSTIAYQGYGKGLDLDAVKEINKLAAGAVIPDLTFIIDCEVDAGLKRAWARINSAKTKNKEDRFEKEDIEFHKRVRDGYLKVAAAEPDRIKVINGTHDIDTIHKEICGIVEKRLNSKLKSQT